MKSQINFMSDFILYANKINSSKGSHLPAGHRSPQLIFYVDCVEEKFHNISRRRKRALQHSSETLSVLNSAEFYCLPFEYFTRCSSVAESFRIKGCCSELPRYTRALELCFYVLKSTVHSGNFKSFLYETNLI